MLLAVCSGLGVILMMAASLALAFEDVVEEKSSVLSSIEKTAEN